VGDFKLLVEFEEEAVGDGDSVPSVDAVFDCAAGVRGFMASELFCVKRALLRISGTCLCLSKTRVMIMSPKLRMARISCKTVLKFSAGDIS
jgi:hypothetical protein